MSVFPLAAGPERTDPESQAEGYEATVAVPEQHAWVRRVALAVLVLARWHLWR